MNENKMSLRVYEATVSMIFLNVFQYGGNVSWISLGGGGGSWCSACYGKNCGKGNDEFHDEIFFSINFRQAELIKCENNVLHAPFLYTRKKFHQIQLT